MTMRRAGLHPVGRLTSEALERINTNPEEPSNLTQKGVKSRANRGGSLEKLSTAQWRATSMLNSLMHRIVTRLRFLDEAESESPEFWLYQAELARRNSFESDEILHDTRFARYLRFVDLHGGPDDAEKLINKGRRGKNSKLSGLHWYDREDYMNNLMKYDEILTNLYMWSFPNDVRTTSNSVPFYKGVYNGSRNFLYGGLRVRGLSRRPIRSKLKYVLNFDRHLYHDIISHIEQVIATEKRNEGPLDLRRYKSVPSRYALDSFKRRFNLLHNFYTYGSQAEYKALNSFSVFGEKYLNPRFSSYRGSKFFQSYTISDLTPYVFQKASDVNENFESDTQHYLKNLYGAAVAAPNPRTLRDYKYSISKRFIILNDKDFGLDVLKYVSPFLRSSLWSGQDLKIQPVQTIDSELNQLRFVFQNTKGLNPHSLQSSYIRRYYFNIIRNLIRYPISRKPVINFRATQQFVGNTPGFDFLYLPEWSFLTSWLLRFKRFGTSLDFKTLEYQPICLDKIRAFKKGYKVHWSHYRFRFRSTKSILAQPRNLSWAGVVHNPVLWFGHFFEAANVLERQYHAFLVYRERFRFMLSFFAPRQHFFFGNIPATFARTNFDGFLNPRVYNLSSYKRRVMNTRLSELQANDFLNHIASRNLAQRQFRILANAGVFSRWLALQKRSYLRSSLHFSLDRFVNNRRREFASFPYGYYNAKWILIPDTYSSSLKWFHRDGFSNIMPGFSFRATAADYWKNRRRYLKYWFSEYEIYKLLKTDVVIGFLIEAEFQIVSFFSNYFFFDFLLIDIKYWLLDVLFLNSIIAVSVSAITPDLFVDFCTTYKFFCIKLLLAVSDRWLWLLMGMSKMFFSTVFYFVYDDIFGFFLLYRGTANMPHAYIPLDPMGYRSSTYYRRQFNFNPSNVINLLPLKFTRRKGQWLAYLGYRRGIEKWDYYHRQGNFLSRFYFSGLEPDSERYVRYKMFFQPNTRLKEIAEHFPKMYKRPVLYAGRVFRRPFEQTRMEMSWLGRFTNVVSYQRIVVKPRLNVLAEKDFPVLRSVKRIKLRKYLKPVFVIHQKLNYSFSIQNELLRHFFYTPDYAKNPLNGPARYKLGLGFSKPVFGQIAPMDLLRNHFFVTSINYVGMPKIEFDRDFNILKLCGSFVHRIRVPLNYSIYTPLKSRLDFHPSRLLFNSRYWISNFNNDPFRKSLFYFFQWDWAGGFFREFFLAPFHTNFYQLLGSTAQSFRTPKEEYGVPYWLSFMRLVSSGRYRNLNRSLDFISGQIHTYDRSLILDRFSYNPNFRGLNPYNLVVNGQSRPFSSFYDFVSRPGARQQSIFNKSQIIRHRNFFPSTAPHFEGFLSYLQYKSLHEGYQPITWSSARDYVRGTYDAFYGPAHPGQDTLPVHKLPEAEINFSTRRQVYYMHVSIFIRFIFRVYSIIFNVTYAYCVLWCCCYKQLLFILVCILFVRLYIYSLQLSFYEYRYMLLEYKNFLIYTKQLYVRKEHIILPETAFERVLLQFFPALYNQPQFLLSEKYYAFRRYLMKKIMSELFFVLFTKPFFDIWFFFKNVAKQQYAHNFIWITFIIKYLVAYRVYYVRYILYLVSLVRIHIGSILYIGLITIIRVFRLIFDPSIPYSKVVVSQILSLKFVYFNIRYFFRIILFILNRILKWLLRSFRFLFIITTLVATLDFYIFSTGQHISDFASSTLAYALIFFVLWLFSLFSKTFSNNFFGSEFPEYQPFLEDAGNVKDIYSVIEPDLFLDDEYDLDEYQEEPYNIPRSIYRTSAPLTDEDHLVNSTGRVTLWSMLNSRLQPVRARIGEALRNSKLVQRMKAGIVSRFPSEVAGLDQTSSETDFTELGGDAFTVPMHVDDLDELLEYEGGSFDFSDGEYFDVENKELLYWVKNNANLPTMIRNLLTGRPVETSAVKLLNLVPQKSFRYSVNAQRFVLYIEALHTLTILAERNFFFGANSRTRQELTEVYNTYIFPYYKYYRRMFNITFEDGPFYGESPEELILSDKSFLEIYRDQDASNLFSEYEMDEAEEEQLEIMETEEGFVEEEEEAELDEFDVLADEDDDLELFGEASEIETDWDDLEEEGFDFFIPAEVPYAEKFLFRPSFAKILIGEDGFRPIELSSLYKSEMFDDILLISESFWISEVLVDRYLIDITEQYDTSFEQDFLIIAKINEYGTGIFDQNILNFKTTEFREFYMRFFKSLKQTHVGFLTVKLKRNLGMFEFTSDILEVANNYRSHEVRVMHDFGGRLNVADVQSSVADFDFNAHFIESLGQKRVFFVVHHPYKSMFKIDMGLKVFPVLGHQVFDNKYKRKFFKNPMYYVNLLGLKNYPDLTLEEFQRLCIFLGCTQEDWDSVDKVCITITRPYDSIDFPLMFTLMLFFTQSRNWFRYEIMQLRYYLDPGLSFIDRLLGGWWLDNDDFRIRQRQAYNELLEYDMPFITIYLSLKEAIEQIFEVFYYIQFFVVEFSKGNVYSFYEFIYVDKYAVSFETFYLLKYFYVLKVYTELIYEQKYQPLWEDLVVLTNKLDVIITELLNCISSFVTSWAFVNLDIIFNFGLLYENFVVTVFPTLFFAFVSKVILLAPYLTYYFSTYYYLTLFSYKPFVYIYPLFPIMLLFLYALLSFVEYIYGVIDIFTGLYSIVVSAVFSMVFSVSWLVYKIFSSNFIVVAFRYLFAAVLCEPTVLIFLSLYIILFLTLKYYKKFF